MGKRSDFERVTRDFYPTPRSAVLPLLPHLIPHTRFIEPCAGDGALITHLESFGHNCVYASDIEPKAALIKKKNVFDIDINTAKNFQCFITNPPWDRKILHGVIERLSAIAPTWLLFDADWMHTKQSIPYMDYCSHIVSIGRVKWFPLSPGVGKENCCWYRFWIGEKKYSWKITEFHGRTS